GRHKRLHVLLNNAGAIFAKRELSVDGHEMTMALNHLGHFLLTDRLLEVMKETARADDNESKEARIINVSSDAHEALKTLDFDELETKRWGVGLAAYQKSKLANVLFTYELDRRLQGSGDRGVTVNCLHPGAVRSGFGHNNNPLFSAVLRVKQLFDLSPEEGAQ